MIRTEGLTDRPPVLQPSNSRCRDPSHITAQDQGAPSHRAHGLRLWVLKRWGHCRREARFPESDDCPLLPSSQADQGCLRSTSLWLGADILCFATDADMSCFIHRHKYDQQLAISKHLQSRAQRGPLSRRMVNT